MQNRIFAFLVALLGWLGPVSLVAAQQFPQTLPANTVVGRLGIGAGPAQAIPLTRLQTALGARTFISVTDYGAVGDSNGNTGNGTNNTTALQAAFNAFATGSKNASTTGLHFPCGIFRFTSGLTMNAAFPQTIYIKGEGLCTKIYFDNTLAGTAWTIAPTTFGSAQPGVVIEDVHFITPTTGAGSRAISIRNMGGVVINRLSSYANYDTILHFSNSYGIWISHSTLAGARGSAVHCDSSTAGATCNNLVLSNNTITGNGAATTVAAIRFGNSAGSTCADNPNNIVIQGNGIESTNYRGIDSLGACAVKITGNYFEGNTNSPISTVTGFNVGHEVSYNWFFGNGTMSIQAAKVRYEGNTFYNQNVTDGSSTGLVWGFNQVEGTSSVPFTSNTLGMVHGQNAGAGHVVQNASTGTSALASYQAINNTSGGSGIFAVYGSNYAATAAFANRVVIQAAPNLDGIAVWAQGADPVVFGVNNAETARLSTTTGTLVLGVATASRGILALSGSTSGTLSIQGPATAGTNTLTFPAGTTDFSATGGASQVVKQTSAGGAFTVARLACADLSDAASGCSASSGITALTGDVTATGPGSVAATLATVNSNVGTFGSATQSVQFTVNAKGLITAAANATITPAVGSITGLGTGIATALAVNVGSAGAPVINGGALGSPSSAGTMPAHTLGGTISGGGNQINNIIIGTTTPLAGFFTTASATTSVTSPLHVGGSGVSQVMSFIATSGVGSGSEGFNFKGGTNGAQSFMTIGSGNVVIDGPGDTQFKLATAGSSKFEFYNASGGAFFIYDRPNTDYVMYHTATGGTTFGNSTTDPGAGALAARTSLWAHLDTAIPAGGTAGAGLKVSSTANFGVFFGSGVPTLSAAKGSLYLRSDGTSTSTRAYINTDGGTTWTAITTAGWLLKRDLDPAANDNTPAFMNLAA